MRVAAAADWLIDLGPGAGDEGGKIVVAGTPQAVAAHLTSKTAIYLAPLLVASE
jgi:excinuclease ABC subunit A